VLLGVSYGTFVAERYALAHPAATRGLVLDSVVEQQGVDLLERVPLRATARVLRAVCAAAARRCAGDPVADLRALLARRPALGPPLLDALTALSIGRPRLAGMPALLHRAATGDLGPLRALLAAAQRGQAAPASLLSQGLHAATLCADSPAPWGGPAAAEPARTRALARLRHTLPREQTAPFPVSTALAQGLLQTCRWWPPLPAPPAPSPNARITVPALLLNGDRDLSTPLEWARRQARRMPAARLVVVPGAGHSVLSRDRGTRGRAPLAAFLKALA
jgi:pimeloyl-ACP methyl ester carboxylesterase